LPWEEGGTGGKQRTRKRSLKLTSSPPPLVPTLLFLLDLLKQQIRAYRPLPTPPLDPTTPPTRFNVDRLPISLLRQTTTQTKIRINLNLNLLSSSSNSFLLHHLLLQLISSTTRSPSTRSNNQLLLRSPTRSSVNRPGIRESRARARVLLSILLRRARMGTERWTVVSSLSGVMREWIVSLIFHTRSNSETSRVRRERF